MPEEKQPEEKKEKDPQKRERQKRIFRIVVPIVLIVAIIVIVIWRLHARHFESTDDAQIDGHIYPVSSQISGHVARVLADDGQLVQAGAMLVQIDPADYRVAMERAQADYNNSLADARASQLNVDISRTQSKSQIESGASGVTNARAELAQAEANAKKLHDDVARYEQLLPKQEISRQQYEQGVTAAKVADNTVVQARAHVRDAEAQLSNARVSPKQVAATAERVKNAAAAIMRAKAGLESAQINLANTGITAPVSGVIAHRTVQPGQNVAPGQELLNIVPLNGLWVTANFKETQLRSMRLGQAVDVHVDAFNRNWKGHVTAIGGATGSKTSLLPPENASGNYVKVVQRIPVRIELEPDANREGLLRPGMSVIPKVTVR